MHARVHITRAARRRDTQKKRKPVTPMPSRMAKRSWALPAASMVAVARRAGAVEAFCRRWSLRRLSESCAAERKRFAAFSRCARTRESYTSRGVFSASAMDASVSTHTSFIKLNCRGSYGGLCETSSQRACPRTLYIRPFGKAIDYCPQTLLREAPEPPPQRLRELWRRRSI